MIGRVCKCFKGKDSDIIPLISVILNQIPSPFWKPFHQISFSINNFKQKHFIFILQSQTISLSKKKENNKKFNQSSQDNFHNSAHSHHNYSSQSYLMRTRISYFCLINSLLTIPTKPLNQSKETRAIGIWACFFVF